MGTVSDGAEGTRMRLSPLARQLHFLPLSGTDETGTRCPGAGLTPGSGLSARFFLQCSRDRRAPVPQSLVKCSPCQGQF